MRRLGPAVLAFLLAGVAGCIGAPRAVHEVTRLSTAEAGEAARIISAYRVSKGLGPVTVDARLNEAAEHQARAVAAAGTLTHGNFASRVREFGIAGYAAENLVAGSATIGDAVVRWKASSGHNENLLMPEARRIGLARADAKGGYGRYWALVLGQ